MHIMRPKSGRMEQSPRGTLQLARLGVPGMMLHGTPSKSM